MNTTKWIYNVKTNSVHEQATTTDPVLWLINKNKAVRSIPVSGAVNWIDGQEVVEGVDFEIVDQTFYGVGDIEYAIPLAAASLQPKEGENKITVGDLRACSALGIDVADLIKFKEAARSLIRADDPVATVKEEDTAAGEDKWISVKDRLPDESGRYWCYVEELNDLGISHFQWNCAYSENEKRFEIGTDHVTHWQLLPKPPQK